MATMTLQEIAEKMRDIDFGMLSTRTTNGAIASRPMSNNGDVEYKGDSFFFSYDSARTIHDIEHDAQVGLSFTGAKGLLGKPPLFIAIEGQAELIRDKVIFAEHWTSDLDRWFEQGVDTPGIVLIKVHAERLHYWAGQDEAEVPLR
ncbi:MULTISPECIES: pyridoxamine 5'-phosphate oxidase family protein [Lichenihabitans]|uniref:pyridoxamine 5'-phosphate oxidase family protein n=1 Tax=Lichenihabitans TaxID=2723776 RepID=UPI00103572CB|nr:MULTISPECIES: pyridoxamine 5'-phosphate oxidase family protein [Lichenihabitans]UDL93678.1 pyridoxamine 5'-phosphate oxidase family protein [Lichenihabitans sp. PAMC28606]